MDYPEVRITMMIERTAESTTLRKVSSSIIVTVTVNIDKFKSIIERVILMYIQVCAIENNLPYYDNNNIL